MPINNFSDNVPRWLSIAELKIDYYTQFIKSWIPFNAWYMVSYNEENYIEKISSLTMEDWRPVLELISKIEGVEQFGDCTKAMELLNKGIISIPQYDEHKVVLEFREAVYSIPIIIDFNWGAWDEGRKIASDENFDFDTIDIPIKCKLITAIVRNDRFCDGALVSAFESGLILKILKSIKHQIMLNEYNIQH